MEKNRPPLLAGIKGGIFKGVTGPRRSALGPKPGGRSPRLRIRYTRRGARTTPDFEAATLGTGLGLVASPTGACMHTLYRPRARHHEGRKRPKYPHFRDRPIVGASTRGTRHDLPQ